MGLCGSGGRGEGAMGLVWEREGGMGAMGGGSGRRSGDSGQSKKA